MDKVHENPDVFRLQMPLLGFMFESVNCYIVVDEGDYLVVDPGGRIPENVPLFEQALAQLGLDPSRMRVFLTHLHSDHSGMVELIAAPEVPIYVGKRDDAYFRREEDPAFWDVVVEQVRVEGVPEDEIDAMMRTREGRKHVVDPSLHEVVFLEDGMRIGVGSYEFSTVEVSGHSPGGMALYHGESGLMFVGDHILYGMTPVVDMTVVEGNGLDLYVESLKRLSGMRIERILPGHGAIEGDHYGRMRQMMDHKLARAQAAYDSIVANPGATGHDAVKSIKWSAIRGSWDETPVVTRAYMVNDGCIALDYLVGKGRLVRYVDDDGIHRYRVARG